jgi:glycosyltransferase involved in cell wall biosynthesis
MEQREEDPAARDAAALKQNPASAKASQADPENQRRSEALPGAKLVAQLIDIFTGKLMAKMLRCHTESWIKMSLISVIIPIYNTEKYLSKCLDSVINQTVNDVEIICINDGSTDGSLSILKEYAKKDSRIVIIDKENQGQAAARNTGLQISTGKYISFVDSDDWIEPSLYERSLHLLENEHTELIIFDANICGDSSTNSNRSMAKYLQTKFHGNVKINSNVILKSSVPPWNKIYRKDIISRYKISFSKGLLYEDNSFHWKYMLQARNAYFLEEKLYNYRIHENSIMHQTKSKASRVEDHFLACLEIFRYMKKYDLLKKYGEALPFFFEHCLGVVLANANDPLKSAKIARNVWSKIHIPSDIDVIRALEDKNYDYLIKWTGYSPMEKIFSLKNRYGKKILSISGIQIPIS